MPHLRALSLCSLMLLSGSGLKADDRPPTDERNEMHRDMALRRHMFENRWEDLIGKWLHEQTTEDGDVVRETHEYRWILGRKFVAVDITATVNGEVDHEARVTVGLDQLSHQDRFWGFDSSGAHWQSVDTLFHEDLWMIKYVGLALNQTNSWTEVMELEGDKYTVTRRDVALAGQLWLTNQEGTIEFTRQPDSED